MGRVAFAHDPRRWEYLSRHSSQKERARASVQVDGSCVLPQADPEEGITQSMSSSIGRSVCKDFFPTQPRLNPSHMRPHRHRGTCSDKHHHFINQRRRRRRRPAETPQEVHNILLMTSLSQSPCPTWNRRYGTVPLLSMLHRAKECTAALEVEAILSFTSA